jgi:cytochrome P450
MPSLAELRVLQRQPHEYFRNYAAKAGRIGAFGWRRIGFTLLTHPEDVEQVLVKHASRYDKRTFQYRLLAEITGEGLLTMDGAEWLERRRAEQPSFHRDRIEDFVPFMVQAAERMTARWQPRVDRGEPIDVAEEMLLVALDIVTRALFGVDLSGRGGAVARATMTVLHAIMYRAQTLRLIPRWLPTRRRREFREAMAVLDRTIYGTIRRRRDSGQAVDPETGVPDLLARLMDPETGLNLDDRALRDEMLTMIIAGHETVASALSWTWYLVAGDMEVDRQLADEAATLGEGVPAVQDLMRLGLHGRVFSEALRLYPPAWIISRRVIQTDTMAGTDLPVGSLVVLSPYVTQRDPAWWDRPDRFDPGRFTTEEVRQRPRFAYFPFGGGGHQCIGNHFAMVEAAVIMSTVVRHYRLDRLPDREVEVDPGVTLTPKGGLTMLVRPRA